MLFSLAVTTPAENYLRLKFFIMVDLKYDIAIYIEEIMLSESLIFFFFFEKNMNALLEGERCET